MQVGMALGRELGRPLGRALGRELGQELGRALGRELGQVPVRWQGQLLKVELELLLDEELERLLGQLLRGQQGSAAIKQKNQWWYWWRKHEDQENKQMEQRRMWSELGWLQSELEQLQPEWESALTMGWVPAQWMLLEVLQLGMGGNLDLNWCKKWGGSDTSMVNSSADKFTNMRYVKQENMSYCYPLT